MGSKGKGSHYDSIPERWEEYTNMGRQIAGTRFIAFKVPLREGIMSKVQTAGRFSLRTLTDHCNLGLVIDLTNTNRFYEPQMFQKLGIEHTKLRTEGKVIPKTPVVYRFFNIVNSFLKKNKDNEKLIGVHCTHGLNRSGYMVCRYMIQQLGIPADQAIADFNSARGHEQEREEYLKDLRMAPWINEVVTTTTASSDIVTAAVTTPPPSTRRSNSYYQSSSERYGDRENDSSRFSWTSAANRRWSRSPQMAGTGTGSGEGGWQWRQQGKTRSSPYTTPSPREHQGPQRYSGSNSSPRENFGRGYFGTTSPREQHQQQHQVQQHSPREAQRYYDTRYQGRVAPQYRHDFYDQEASGVGPHRVHSRWTSKQYHEQQPSTYRPRQYRGPRPYRSPEPRDQEETPQTPTAEKRDGDRGRVDNFSTPQQQQHYPIMQEFNTPLGPMRNPLSPGAMDNVFSPDYSTRRRSARWNPY